MTRAADVIRVCGQSAHFHGRRFTCATGRGGIKAVKREGDGVTPAGEFGLLRPLFRPGRVHAALFPDARPIRRFDVWSDDPGDPLYNHLVPSVHRYSWSCERLWRTDHQYDLVIPVAYNWPDPVPGAGSAIFIHIWRGPGRLTDGCVAFAPADLTWIARRISNRTRLAVRPTCCP